MVTWAAVFGIAYLSSVIATSLLSELAIAAALLGLWHLFVSLTAWQHGLRTMFRRQLGLAVTS